MPADNNGKNNKTESTPIQQNDEPILLAVRNFNAGWKNKDESIKERMPLGNSMVYTVCFFGQDNKYYENFVIDDKKNIRVFSDLGGLMKSLHPHLSFLNMPAETIRVFSLSAIALIAIISISVQILRSGDANSLEALITFAGIIVGYLAGKST